MRKQQKMFPIFIISAIVIFLLTAFSRSSLFLPIENGIQQIFLPLQHFSFTLFSKKQTTADIEKLQQENKKLHERIKILESLEKENRALRDQYDRSVLPTKKLLPVSIVGIASTTKKLHMPNEFVINAGSMQGVKVGQALIANDIFIGKIYKTSAHISVVRGTLHEEINISAYAEKNTVLGIIKGREEIIVFDNVLLSDELIKGSRVLTKGNIDANGIGIPPDLIIGEITSVNKRPSALFQSAEVKPAIDFTKVSTAFVVLQY